MNQAILYLFTRTPLHVGAGSSVGAIDQPIQRERHTGFPIIPGSSLKGVLRDQFQADSPVAEWLFGSSDANNPAAGAVQCGEGRLLTFPVRSAKGCFAWLTSPLILARFARDSGIPLPDLPNAMPADQARYKCGGPLDLNGQVVLEDYTCRHDGDLPQALLERMAGLLDEDPVWPTVTGRLVLVSDELMAHFATTACEVAQHIRISEQTGTVAHGALFNQENVPSETLFYSLLTFFNERAAQPDSPRRAAADAAGRIKTWLSDQRPVLQLGADSGTGLGFCTVTLKEMGV